MLSTNHTLTICEVPSSSSSKEWAKFLDRKKGTTLKADPKKLTHTHTHKRKTAGGKAYMKINSAGKLRSAAELRARERGYLHSWGQQAGGYKRMEQPWAWLRSFPTGPNTQIQAAGSSVWKDKLLRHN